MTKILIAKEKHGDRYFDVSSKEQLHKVALYLLKQRFEAGYWYYEPKPVEALGFEEKDLSTMPASLQEDAEKRLNRYYWELKTYKEELANWQDIQEAIKNSDGALALQILECRDRFEYESVYVEECEEVE
jgi:hypothetical protein